MISRLSKLAVASGTAAMLSTGALVAVPKPAAAQSQGTINTLLGAAALVGGLVLYNNYEHKRQAANTIVGYTANGGTIFGDGRIQLTNGQTIYPNANGQYPWGQYAYYDQNANSGYQYDYNRSGQWDRTRRHRFDNASGNANWNNGNGNWHKGNGNWHNGNGQWNNGNGQWRNDDLTADQRAALERRRERERRHDDRQDRQDRDR